MNVNFIIITGNPSNGVSNRAIVDSLKEIKHIVKNKVVLQVTGILENTITTDGIKCLLKQVLVLLYCQNLELFCIWAWLG